MSQETIPASGKVQVLAARLAIFFSVLFVGLLIALHFLRPDLDPTWRFISEYEMGDHGWVMRLAFFSLAASCLALVVAIGSQIKTIAGWIGASLVLLASVGMTLAGIFEPEEIHRTHELGAMLDHLPFGALLINWSLARHHAWKNARLLLGITAPLPLLGLAYFVGSMIVMLPRNDGKPGPEVLVGWPNRVMILAHCAWIIPLAWHVLNGSRRLTDRTSSAA